MHTTSELVGSSHDLRCRFDLRSGDHRNSPIGTDGPSAGCLGSKLD